ncbi:hypothetical protein WQ54_02205 [Bacillus sp. SA1-12]|uniref:hypothetical protein n=1 Tax=Bacillus sp. SA1-12 TaxID=1455638 RepID=UPI0006264212|nr:hypothetical protein [Bacillus sp. SA1-12]KKI93880.1 hypothetical protein WQ54_02205 [Bacillus sp. SA1-12]
MKYFLLFIMIAVCSACNVNDQDEALNNTGKKENRILQTGKENTITNDDILIENREEENLDEVHDPSHPTRAEELVRDKFDLEKNRNLIVQYDHLEKGKYIIHVYSVEGSQENSEAWYMVDLQTKNVEPLRR